MKKYHLKYKGYPHFDKKMSVCKAKKLVTRQDIKNNHGFYPFIKFVSTYDKFGCNERKSKERSLFYSAHLDRYLYQQYAHELSMKYNVYVASNHLNTVSIAYRTNLKMSNIDFAFDAFNFIKHLKESTIIIGDFTSFFDNLSHKNLKERLSVVLGDRLSDYEYKIFKSITKYSYIEVESLYEYYTNKNGKRSEKYFIRSLDRLMDSAEFRGFVKNPNVLKKNINHFGIVQGSPVSGLYANIYMLDFDAKMNQIASKLNGKYMRYSDDFIIIFDNSKRADVNVVLDEIKSLITEDGSIELHKDKTQIFKCTEGNVYRMLKDNDHISWNHGIINYLGFSFDGTKVDIREKTKAKYHYRMAKSVKHYKKSKKIKHRRYSLKKVFIKYTKQGSSQGRSNFISYVNRSNKKFINEHQISKLKNQSKKILIRKLSKK